MRRQEPRTLRPAEPRDCQSINPGNESDDSPGQTESQSSSVQVELLPKRKAVSIACDGCRKRKERCDGQRPICASCSRRQATCTYSRSLHEPSHSVVTFKKQYEALKTENNQLRELYVLLGKLPDREAHNLLAHIRATHDPISVLNLARRINLYQDNPEPHPGLGESSWNPRLASLDLEILTESPIKVRARPWTPIANDGLVSELISSFFLWDDAFFYPFIDRDAFLEDMEAGNISEAKYCSPFLVNAICASRCVSACVRRIV